MDETFDVHMALNLLQMHLNNSRFHTTHKEKWGMDEMISICVQEVNKPKKGKAELVNYVHAGNGKKLVNIGKTFKPYNSYGTNVVGAPSSSRGPQVYKGNYENIKCFFCK